MLPVWFVHVLRVHVLLPMSLENFSQPGAMDPKMLVHAHVVILSCQQMPCNTPACHDDMSHIRIGSSPPYPLLLSNNKHVVPENAVQTCQGAAWGARRWEGHDARRRLFFQSVFEPGGQGGLLAWRLVSCKLSVLHQVKEYMGNSASRLVNVVVSMPPAARPPSSGAIDGPCPSRTRGKHTSARTSDEIKALLPA